jgi:outer membrane protein insertion porin family/translocation and assembly module TamA
MCIRQARCESFGTAACCALVALSCATIPERRYALQAMTLHGNENVDDDEIEDKIASRESPKFLGLFPGVVYDYQIFDRHVLERDLQRIERYYRARGHYKARVRAGLVRYTGPRSARVDVVIEEGPPGVVARIDVHGLSSVPVELRERARGAALALLSLGAPFDEEAYRNAGEGIRRTLTDAGYASAKVERSAKVDLARDFASVGYWVEPGERLVLGEIRLVGLGPVPEAPVRRALDLEPGEPYSQTSIEDAQQALLELGAFSSVVIEPELERVEGNRVPLVVRLVPSRFRTLYVGGGAEADAIHTQIHLLAGYENRNFLGGLRRFRFEVRPGVVLYPTRIPGFQRPEQLLPQVRVRTELRQPGFPEARTRTNVRGEVSVYPVLLTSDDDEGQPILGYRDYRAAAGLDRSFRRFYANLSQNLQVNRPFTYRGALDPDLDIVIISYPELMTTLDLRDSPISAHSGAYFALTAQAAGAGGDARDAKLVPEARGYVPISRQSTLALRGRLGMLFPDNYGSTLVSNALTGTPGDASRAEWVRDIQILFLRGFFGGGPGSNRGYAAREIGPHGTVPFYNPGQSSEATSERCLSAPDSSCDLPLGGLSLWEASVELRFPLLGPLTGATFADAGDVSPYRMDFRFQRLHLSAGAGIRYDTPVGPIRADIGYRIPGLQGPSGADEGTPTELFGLPAAFSVGIGESF